MKSLTLAVRLSCLALSTGLCLGQIDISGNVIGPGGGPVMSHVIGSINVTTGSPSSNAIEATFTFAPGFGWLDECYDFRWVNVEAAYSLAPPSCGAGMLPPCGAQPTDPVLGTLPAIDPQQNTSTFPDALPFYWDQALFNANHVEGISSTFFDARSEANPNLNSVISFNTFLVAYETSAQNQPADFCVLGGFSWTYTNLTAMAMLFSQLGPDAQLINMAIGNANPPFAAGWAAIAGCLLNCKPEFTSASSCGTNLAYSVGTPFMLTVTAMDPNPAEDVTLAVVGLPPGAALTPSLPIVGNPVSTVVSWTPSNVQIATYSVVWTATDDLGRATTCTTTLVIDECYLLLGFNEVFLPIGPEPDDVLLLAPLVWYPVAQQHVPGLFIPNNAGLLNLTIAAQVGMWNPIVFPGNPLQMSNGLRLTIGNGIQSYGFSSGISLTGDPVPTLGSTYDFAFVIQ